MKNLEVIALQATIGVLVASEDASENTSDSQYSLIRTVKNMLAIYEVLKIDQNTVNKKWVNLMSSEAKFFFGENKITI